MTPLVTPETMAAIEKSAFARGVNAGDLMEHVGNGMARVVAQYFPTPGTVIVFAGKGHNAGDGFVAARILASWGWGVEIHLTFDELAIAPLAREKLHELRNQTITPNRAGCCVVLDGLLGIGSRGEPRDPIRSAIAQINTLRRERHAFVFAADIPSGLDPLSGIPSAFCVQADCTMTVAFPKSGLVADAATNYVGRLAVIPVAELVNDTPSDAMVITGRDLRSCLPPRDFDSHKGTWGKVGIIAGSPQYYGAAVFCSAAAVAAGAGLVTLYAQEKTADILRMRCIPEVMVKSVPRLESALDDALTAIAIGPGLGDSHDAAIARIIHEASCGMVIDADAINALSRNPEPLDANTAPRLLTPHPVEMNRLVPGSLGSDRRHTAQSFVAARPHVTLLLKGSRTIIANAMSPVRYNTTGNPGMGSGGMGDVLTGVCAAMMARGIAPIDAASVAAWVCGRTAESVIFQPGGSPESLTASGIIANLGAGFHAAINCDSY